MHKMSEPLPPASASADTGLRVPDARAHCERARQYNAEDFAGHQRTFSETLADVAPQTWGGEYITPD